MIFVPGILISFFNFDFFNIFEHIIFCIVNLTLNERIFRVLLLKNLAIQL